MVYAPKESRNQSIVEKRIKDPKKWSWGKLGQYFAIHRSVVKEIFDRDVEKYANEDQIVRRSIDIIARKIYCATYTILR